MCGCLQEPEGGISFPGSGVIGDCEPPVVGTGICTPVLMCNSYRHCVPFIFEIEK